MKEKSWSSCAGIFLRMTLCILLILAKSCFFLVEQPRQSLLYRHNRFEWLCNRVCWVSWYCNVECHLHIRYISMHMLCVSCFGICASTKAAPRCSSQDSGCCTTGDLLASRQFSMEIYRRWMPLTKVDWAMQNDKPTRQWRQPVSWWCFSD